MIRSLVLAALVFAAPGCKSMGHLGSGLGRGLGHVASGMGHVASGMSHVASGLGHVASGVGHVASGVGRAVGPVARAAQKALPIVEDVVEAAALASATDESEAGTELDEVPVPDDGDPPVYVSQDGPLIDNHDPCNACPDDEACDQCIGAGGVACRLTPPDAYTRCESSVP